MKCILIDDEPIAREGLEAIIKTIPELKLMNSFGSAEEAIKYIKKNTVDLIFLDIEMPEINGIEFAKKIPKQTLVIFTTAYSEYALDSYEVDAIDYLVKPLEQDRLKKAVKKAISYHTLLANADNEEVETTKDFIFVKSNRRYFRVVYKDILFIEGLKDYVIIQTQKDRIITKMYLSTIYKLLPNTLFFRINKSYIINMDKIISFDTNDVFIEDYEIAIGNTYRENFYTTFTSGNLYIKK